MAVADPKVQFDADIKKMISDAVATQTASSKADFDKAVKEAVQKFLQTGQVAGVQSGVNQHYFDDPLGVCIASPHPVLSPSDACGKTHVELIQEFLTAKTTPAVDPAATLVEETAAVV
jgi:hypothetical protein